MCRMGCSVSEEDVEPEPPEMVEIKKFDLERFIKTTCKNCPSKLQEMLQMYEELGRDDVVERVKKCYEGGCWNGCYVNQYKKMVENK